jgi:hypothetical protein
MANKGFIYRDTDNYAVGLAGATMTATATTYEPNIGISNLIRTGDLMGLDSEPIFDLRIAPSFTLTAPEVGAVYYYGASIDLSNLSVITDNDFGVIAALHLRANLDLNDGTNYALFVESGLTYLAGAVKYGAQVYSVAEVDNGHSKKADTIDWTLGNNQKSKLTSSVVYTFVPPSGPAQLVLRMVQNASGKNVVTWPKSVKWSGGVEPEWDTTGNTENYAFFYYNGADFIGSGITNIK